MVLLQSRVNPASICGAWGEYCTVPQLLVPRGNTAGYLLLLLLEYLLFSPFSAGLGMQTRLFAVVNTLFLGCLLDLIPYERLLVDARPREDVHDELRVALVRVHFSFAYLFSLFISP